jgi:aminoglycoside N3'-acetyltransferase
MPDAVETIARAYVAERRHARGRVGDAECHLFDARDLVDFGTRWLAARHGAG